MLKDVQVCCRQWAPKTGIKFRSGPSARKMSGRIPRVQFGQRELGQEYVLMFDFHQNSDNIQGDAVADGHWKSKFAGLAGDRAEYVQIAGFIYLVNERIPILKSRPIASINFVGNPIVDLKLD